MRRSTMSVLPAVATRCIHARGYNNFQDVVSWKFNECNFNLMYAKNTTDIVQVYQRYGEETMTPEQIMFGFNFIC